HSIKAITRAVFLDLLQIAVFRVSGCTTKVEEQRASKEPALQLCVTGRPASLSESFDRGCQSG
ncbi:MAG: hypothetical protein WCC40_03845, partial [Rhodomicrobium sp.]